MFSLWKQFLDYILSQVVRMVGENNEVTASVGGGSSGNSKMPTLEEYGTNLTKLAEEVIKMAYLTLILKKLSRKCNVKLLFSTFYYREN